MLGQISNFGIQEMKHSSIKRRPLADTVLATLEPESKAYREHDGGGLYFRVKPNGSKSWELRYKNAAGKWSWLGMGAYPEVGGELARKKARSNREQLSRGIDPLQQKRAAKERAEQVATRTFRAAAEDWYQRQQAKGLEQSTLCLLYTSDAADE